MKRFGVPALAIAVLGAASGWAADATTPIDYTQRNDAYAPGQTVTPKKQAPETNSSVQDKRVEKTVIDRQTAPVADRKAPIEMKELREKQVREKDSHRPEKVEQPTSAYNHKNAAISTEVDTRKPPTVSKYQDGIAAASAANMARFPAIDGATSARINRFTFRKNPAESNALTAGAPIVPAAGGGPLK